jgi:hypothetical protein
MVSARPVATWLAESDSVRKPKISAAAAAASAAQSDSQPMVPGDQHYRHGDHRADQHHALDAEVEDTGFLHHQLAQRGQQDRRRSPHQRDDDGNDQIERHAEALAGSLATRRMR